MYLDAVSPLEDQMYDAGVIGGVKNIFGPWEHWRPAELSHHGRSCCEIVKEWIIAMDLSLLNGGSKLTGPRWLRHRFEWGPTRYPIYWCEIGRAKVLDCGVHAALAQEIFLARGVRCFRAQLVQEYSRNAAEQWLLRWEERDAITTWMEGELIYHEGCAVVDDENLLRLWDPSAGWWVDPDTTSGYGSLRALRIAGPVGPAELKWGGHLIASNEWTVIKNRKTPTASSSQPSRTFGSTPPPRARVRLR